METLEKHFRNLTGASFAKRGRAAADLMAQWPAIAGERLSAICTPERIKWPKGTGQDGQGGTLILRAAPGQGLAVSYETQVLIERINVFFGYQAIVGVKVTQGHRRLGQEERAKLPQLAPDTAAALEQRLSSIADEHLKAALKRLGAGALAPRRSSPQAK
jgi:hypothetical protein